MSAAKLAGLLGALLLFAGCYKVVTVGYLGVTCIAHPIDCWRAIHSESDVTPTPEVPVVDSDRAS